MTGAPRECCVAAAAVLMAGIAAQGVVHHDLAARGRLVDPDPHVALQGISSVRWKIAEIARCGVASRGSMSLGRSIHRVEAGRQGLGSRQAEVGHGDD